ncbi:cyclin-dependent kinase inhibitor 2A isoform p19ARF [Mus musculus]|uniref:Tumor suppressor ARF n=4 Tax=Mus TaxID=862507 RepID=ARF_MOUSE|nr:cyclin-dependent kinase inhibitor 2A isoform p19ARF [Mus musculus]Q64364.1 RecName: Full=Tumor suppressor ARF; AltName: Full=Alternative reading frame; Short=ARF; AltName: Full=Cyclin-dependent kinase inhibitor 2A; AltName: Full=p19ARF [Mus musculus]AAB35770.1 P19 ARF protein [Mus sp.]AAC42080.1 p19 ARF protein [Mus musculus]AAH58190.3 Cyclin-dependent kinase inhibitor 2A [Mus musculus]EDL30951.1 cyclin-dependent kinase inhibitor 2A [Mus musculus]|eukprot:NP_034007.1 cyclin-dependent kinase inhibitor 2A p19ARF [Mus musculus]
MGRRFLVTVRIQRAGRPLQERVFLVKFVRSRRPRTASCALAFVNMLLRLERILRRGPHRNPGPGDDDGQRSRSSSSAQLRCRFELRGPHYLLPPGARRSAGRLPGHAGGAARVRGSAGCARCLGSPAARLGPRAGTSRHRAIFAFRWVLFVFRWVVFVYRWERRPDRRA